MGSRGGAAGAAAAEPLSLFLKPYNTVPPQLLNATGTNNLSEISLKALWDVVSKGNKVCPYFYEGVEEDVGRQSVGASRAMGAIQQWCESVKQGTHYDSFVQEEFLASCRAEIDTILPHLQTLNGAGIATPGSKPSDPRRAMFNYDGNGSNKRQRTDTTIPTEEDVRAAAKIVYDWLVTKESKLRFLLAVCGNNGLSHNAQCYDKVLRAHVAQRSMAVGDFQSMMVRRFDPSNGRTMAGGASDLSLAGA